jgi:peptide/nickel transport system ATP-binding protein
VYARPRHPYTVELLDAVPRVEQAALGKRTGGDLPGADNAAGDPASPVSPPSGCRFRTRCPRAAARCAAETPVLVAPPGSGPGHLVACHFPVPGPASASAPDPKSHEISRNEEQSAS